MNKLNFISNLIRCSIICGSFIMTGYVKAQVHYPKNVPIAPSPEVSSLLRNVMCPVDLYTGVLDVVLPLYSLACRDIQVPIMMNYRTSGIKVHDLPTWVGLGWNLSAGLKEV